MRDPLTEVLEARQAYVDARAEARVKVERARAELGLSIVQARQAGQSQSAVMKALRLSREQVRAFERAYREWLRDHKDEPLG